MWFFVKLSPRRPSPHAGRELISYDRISAIVPSPARGGIEGGATRRSNRCLSLEPSRRVSEAILKKNRIFGGFRGGTRIWEREPSDKPHPYMLDLCNS
jgi:hypothetical protein